MAILVQKLIIHPLFKTVFLRWNNDIHPHFPCILKNFIGVVTSVRKKEFSQNPVYQRKSKFGGWPTLIVDLLVSRESEVIKPPCEMEIELLTTGPGNARITGAVR